VETGDYRLGDRESTLFAMRVADLEAFWPTRRLNAFDGLCPEAAPCRAAGPAA
jgi:hypothetical protein